MPLRSAGELQEDPDGSWLALLGLVVSGAGELWNGPCTASLGVLLPALAAGARLLSWHLLGWLYGFWACRRKRERSCTGSGPGRLERRLPCRA